MRNRSLKKALRLASKAVKLQKKWLALNGLIAAVLSKGDCLADKRGLGVVEVDAETIDQLFGSIAGGSPARVFLATDFAELKSFLKITYSGPNTALDAAGSKPLPTRDGSLDHLGSSDGVLEDGQGAHTADSSVGGGR